MVERLEATGGRPSRRLATARPPAGVVVAHADPREVDALRLTLLIRTTQGRCEAMVEARVIARKREARRRGGGADRRRGPAL